MIKEYNASMHKFNVAIIDCSYTFQLFQVAIRLYTSGVKRKLCYIEEVEETQGCNLQLLQ